MHGYRSSSARRQRAWPHLLTVAALLALTGSCTPTSRLEPPPQQVVAPDTTMPRVDAIRGEPIVRVRVGQAQQRVTLTGERDADRLVIAPGPASRQARSFPGPVQITRDGDRFVLRAGNGHRYAWAVPRLRITRQDGDTLRLDGDRVYPGAIVLVATRGEGDAQFDIVNHVQMERYLPGVLERELYGSWRPATFQAQAIAARSYAFFEMAANRDRHFDMHDSSASQVYGGLSEHAPSLAAVRRTRGEVVVHANRVVPAFYSSCCGGLTQSARTAFPGRAPVVDVPSLAGGVQCTSCDASPNHRWDAIHRSRDDTARRIAAWGAANGHSVAGLRGLVQVRALVGSVPGRPGGFELVDQRGTRFRVPPEALRAACNHEAEDLPPLPRDQQLRSSHVRVQVAGGRVSFTQGRGFGHGVGLCQWGAQGLAERGRSAHQIVQHYYPGATIRAAY
ncbi:MAG: SpoIID/LytB domain-containing protein [Phycisphaeraceae bacterium]